MMKVSSEVFRLQVLVNGKAVQEYRGPGQNVFVEGRDGSKFELELTNLTPRRILVHPAVDGLSVMTGKPAAQNDSTDGYVLTPYQTMRVPGWRLDDKNVAQFFFAGQGNSYAEQTGQPLNKGVIACPVWEEKKDDWLYMYPPILRGNVGSTGGGGSGTFTHSSTQPLNIAPQQVYTCQVGTSQAGTLPVIPDSYTVTSSLSSSDASGLAQESISSERKCSVNNLGTGFGDKTKHEVVSVHFTPQDQPTCTAIIYYDTVEGLRTRGIKIQEKSAKQAPRLPDPFPKTSPKTGCTPPPGWVE